MTCVLRPALIKPCLGGSVALLLLVVSLGSAKAVEISGVSFLSFLSFLFFSLSFGSAKAVEIVGGVMRLMSAHERVKSTDEAQPFPPTPLR